MVTVETVDSWPVAEASLAELGESGGESGEWEASAAQADDGSDDGDLLGGNALLIGGLVVAAGVGAFLLLDDDDEKDREPPPAPTGLDLAAADDKGASSTDNITNVTTALTISGSALVSAEIVISCAAPARMRPPRRHGQLGGAWGRGASFSWSLSWEERLGEAFSAVMALRFGRLRMLRRPGFPAHLLTTIDPGSAAAKVPASQPPYGFC